MPEVSYNDPPDFTFAAFVLLGLLIGAGAVAIVGVLWVLLPAPVFEVLP